ncbi:MAG: thioesterase family protein [Myxococcales bacterium]|jgi:hypothetical protein|nr:MAG: thioesterase family protein [Myxococcales bacterium]
MLEALYERDRDLFVPSILTAGPWSPDAQHGSAPAALLARAGQRFEPGEPIDGAAGAMEVARVTVELLRPVPLAPVKVTATWLRPGKKVQLVGVNMTAGDTEVARATLLRIRRKAVRLPDSLPATERALRDAPAGPDAGTTSAPPWARHVTEPAFHSHAVEHRFVAGGFDRPGPARDWIRLRVPVVAGEQSSPLCRVMAASDFGNGVSWELSRDDGYQFINPDLTVYLHRRPQGEWICLDAATYPSPDGVGLAESMLYDERGPIGRSLQSLLLDQI